MLFSELNDGVPCAFETPNRVWREQRRLEPNLFNDPHTRLIQPITDVRGLVIRSTTNRSTRPVGAGGQDNGGVLVLEQSEESGLRIDAPRESGPMDDVDVVLQTIRNN